MNRVVLLGDRRREVRASRIDVKRTGHGDDHDKERIDREALTRLLQQLKGEHG